MLCYMLAATGRMGAPNSFFRQEDLRDWAKDWNIPLSGLPGAPEPSSDFLQGALAAGRGDTPVFGMRLMYESLPALLDYLCALSPANGPDKTLLETAFGPLVFIHLHREDTIAQAISLLRAEQSGLWHKAADGTDIERLEPTQAQGYDFDRLQDHVERLTSQKAGWQRWFQDQGLSPILVTYTELTDHPAQILRRICKAARVAAPQSSCIKPVTAKLRDSTSDAWRARYLKEAGLSGSGA